MKLNKTFYLDNGMRVIINPESGLHSIGMALAVDYGALNEPVRHGGAAYVSANSLYEIDGTFKDRVAREGIESVPIIDYELSMHVLKSPRSKLKESCDLLTELISQRKLTETALRSGKERAIGKIRMREDEPMYHAFRKLKETMFGNSRAAMPVEGSQSTVSNLSRSTIEDILKREYIPKNMAISIYGGVNFEKAFRAVTDSFGDLSNPQTYKRQVASVPFMEPRAVYLQEPGINQTNMAFGLRLDASRGISGEQVTEMTATEAINVLLGYRLFDELRNKRGLVYSADSNVHRDGHFDFLRILTATEPKNSQEVEKLVRVELQKIANGEFTHEDLRRARKELKVDREDDFGETDEMAATIVGFELSNGDAVSRLQAPERKVDLDALRAAGQKYFNPKKAYLVAIAPKE